MSELAKDASARFGPLLGYFARGGGTEAEVIEAFSKWLGAAEGDTRWDDFRARARSYWIRGFAKFYNPRFCELLKDNYKNNREIVNMIGLTEPTNFAKKKSNESFFTFEQILIITFEHTSKVIEIITSESNLDLAATSAYLEAISRVRQGDVHRDWRGKWPSEWLSSEDFGRLRDALSAKPSPDEGRAADVGGLIEAWSRPFLLCVAALTVPPPHRDRRGRPANTPNLQRDQYAD